MNDLSHLVGQQNPVSDQIKTLRDEIDEVLDVMQQWPNTDPDTVMREISAYGARLIQIRTNVVRSESRAHQAFRTKELDPLIEEIRQQFKIHSRRLSSMTLDWEISKGGT